MLTVPWWVDKLNLRKPKRKANNRGLKHERAIQMNVGLSVASPEAERVLIELMREAPVWRRLEIVGEMNAAVRLAHPQRAAPAPPRCRAPEELAPADRRHLARPGVGSTRLWESLPPEWEAAMKLPDSSARNF